MQGLFIKRGNEHLIKDYTGVMFMVKGITGDITNTFVFRDLRPWTGESGTTKH